MGMVLFELKGKGDLRFSPYAWRARLALAHKGLEAERMAIGFTEKAKIASGGYKQVPVLVDGGTEVPDSWAIACHLEDNYPDRPSLFGGPVGRAGACFINAWADSRLHPAMAPLILGDVFDRVEDADRAYFRETREARFGTTIEAVHAARDSKLAAWDEAMTPLRLTLKRQPYLSGEAPAYADYIVFGSLQWARCASPYPLFTREDPIHAWREHMLDLFGAMPRHAPGNPVGERAA